MPESSDNHQEIANDHRSDGTNPRTANANVCLTLSLATASLWASAFVLAALIVVQAGRADFGHNAIAEMASSGTEYAMMTTRGGNEELLYVLDKRIGQLFVYEAVFGGGGDMRLHTAVNVGEMIAKRSRGSKK